MIIRIAGALTIAALAAFGAPNARAHDYKAGTIHIIHPWARATPGGAKVAGGFLVIENTGKEPDFLIGGSLGRAKSAEIHEMTTVGDVMKMRHLQGGLEIRPGEKVALKPGSYHMMFMDLSQPLKAGEKVEGTLVFKKAGTIKVSFKVEAIGAPSAGHGNHGAAKSNHGMKH
jgi:copper(I)-binding protein